MGIAKGVPTGRGIAHLSAMPPHAPAAFVSRPALSALVIIIDTIVIAAQGGQIRRGGVPAVLVGIDVVYLAPISGHIAIRPRAHEVLRFRQ